MTRYETLRAITTADGLNALNPDVFVKRHRLGGIDAQRRDADGVMGRKIRMGCSQLAVQFGDLALPLLSIVGDTRLRAEENHTVLRIPVAPDGLDNVTVQHQGLVKPPTLIALAREATELLVVYEQLSIDEQWEWRYANGPEGSRVYDTVRPPADSIEVLSRAGHEFTEVELAVDSLRAARVIFGLVD